jgi:hypothetical protein
MTWVCIRIGCSASATTRLLLDPVDGVAALDNFVGQHGAAAILCDEHAGRVQVPKGWSLDDRRRFPAKPSPDEPPSATKTDAPKTDETERASGDSKADAAGSARKSKPRTKGRPVPPDGLLARAFAQAEVRSSDLPTLFCAS